MILLIQKSNFGGPRLSEWHDIAIPDADVATRRPVKTVEEFAERIKASKAEGSYRVITRDGRVYIVEVERFDAYAATIRDQSK